MEGTVDVPSGWTMQDTTPRGTRIELQFAVKQQHVKELQSTLMDISTPTSKSYGMHLSNEQVQTMTAPLPLHIQAVQALLEQHGATASKATPNSDVLKATVPVEVAEAILGAKYVQLRHTSNITVHRAVAGYSLPASVASAVDFVSPTVHVPGVRKALSMPAFGKDNTPVNLRDLYSIGKTVGKASTNSMAVTAFLGQEYSEEDLKSYWSTYCTAPGITCGKGLPKLVGDATTGTAGVESMLDIQTITGVAGNIAAEFWGFGGSSPDNPANEPFMKWLTQMSSTSDKDIPKIFSTSYGEDESSWSYAASERLNTEFIKAGARGISLLYAAGDEGANCKGGKFVPEGPGSSPYVTAVGGTQPMGDWPSPGGEEAVGLSSGGFSNYWPMPDWQKTAVNGYLSGAAGLPKASRGYNVTNRAYPDVAAQAVNYCVPPFGCGVAGTSCATPATSGIFALLNDVRLQNGKPSLGFLNPFIYQNAAAFNDITSGSSSGCTFSEGWPAVKGWDAVTGVGTPNYAKLAAIVAALP